jgi:molecular chaperone Hsp33
MAECSQGQKLRGIVRGDWDSSKSSTLSDSANLAEVMGSGTLAITIEPDQGERYQGIVQMAAADLSGCLEHYFEQSAQLLTKIKIAVDQNIASGLLIQQMPITQNFEQAKDDWQHLSTLMDTLKSNEQLVLSHNDQLYRLFHEDDVRLFESQPVSFFCSCSHERTERALVSLGEVELLQTCEEQGLVLITCQFCDQQYQFSENAIKAMFNTKPDILH